MTNLKDPKSCMDDRILTPGRILRGALCLLMLFSTAFAMVTYCGFPTAVLLRLISLHCSRQSAAFFFEAWLALWPFLFEKINNTKVVFSGERVPSRERVLLMSNHRTEVDWMYIWDFGLRKGRLGYIKYVLKSSLMKLPVFGWAFHFLEFIPVARKWKLDEPNMRRMLTSFKDPRDPLWLALFPEGTDYTEQKCLQSKAFAAENGLPILENVLLPKTKGFFACLEELRASLDAVYDVTMGYKTRRPSLLDNVFGVEPAEVHVHVRRLALSDIPRTEKEVADWLMSCFQLKDRLLSDFYTRGHFPCEGTETSLSTVKCLANFVAVMVFTGICTYLTFFSSHWFKIYVTLVCGYLASATYFDFRPVPFLGVVKGICSKRRCCE